MAWVCHFFIPTPLRPTRLCIRAFQSHQPAPSALYGASSLSETLIAIQSSYVIAGLRAKDGLVAMEAARAALRGGISVLEVMMSTPDASMVIQGLLQENPSFIIGVTSALTVFNAGTVLNVDDAREAIGAGARFLTSPCTVMEIIHEVEGSGVLYAPGVMTPTEVLCAYEAGAKLVKQLF